MIFDLNAPLPSVYPRIDEIDPPHDDPPFHYGDMMDLADVYINDHKDAIELIYIEIQNGIRREGASWGKSILDIASDYGWCVSVVLPAAKMMATLGLIELHFDKGNCPCDACVAHRSWVSLPIDYEPIKRVLWAQHRRDVVSAQVEAKQIISRHANRLGYVYLVKCGPRYKIGITKNMNRRMDELKGQSPYPMEIVHCVQGIDNSAMESRLHRAYDSYRVHGEWFELTPDQVASVVESLNDWQRQEAD